MCFLEDAQIIQAIHPIKPSVCQDLTKEIWKYGKL